MFYNFMMHCIISICNKNLLLTTLFVLCQADEIQQPIVRSCSSLPETVELKPTSHLRSVLLLAVLSIHSVFEGLAIGLQSNMAAILNIFVAVMLHKVCLLTLG